ncbi:uncharacterized protein BHQ10_010102 [Talaromyces amestolkiae]|uniref:SCP domain-containing protein n=1 Tax=Talaromyces amestolkiae TaxID=1196081 RepID=A0A364LE43_TALAM|nr:uncharacterized protein BHQ10_010102 [Talaromyces amestolkiae]RAO74090.1 hypothetical protein BHQ10_010102 [Talaromyces amestolkiae]
MMLLAFAVLIMSAAADWFPPHRLAPSESPMPGYDIVELSWEVTPTPGQPAIILNGTVEQVRSQLLAINPRYQFGFIAKRGDLLAAPTAATDLTEPTAVAHSAQIWKMTCGGYDSADTSQIEDGIKYLNGIAGQPKNGPGPNNCGRVSCSYNSSIWWCNDNASPQALPGFYTIATGATKIINACLGQNNSTVSGTGEHPGNWRVVVKGDIC